MHYLKSWSTHLRRFFLAGGMTTALLLTLWVAVTAQSTPLSPFGYLDFSYNGYTGAGSATGEKPESKLWWNDGFWWGSLFNSTTLKFHIYRLNWGTQTWEDTGVVIDDRPNTKADTLWDSTAQKLYIASHVAIVSDGEEVSTANSARLYRYSYDAALQKYTLDQSFPVTINKDQTETLVLTKGAGRFWITYVSRGTTPKANPDYRVFVNSSADGATWGAPFVPTLNVTTTAVHVARGDIAAVVAFSNSVGIMWNNTISPTHHTLHFAYRDANISSSSAPWTHEMISVPGGADDHISLRSLQATGNGQVFAAIKTSTPLTDPLTQTIALVGMVARDVNGAISFHMYSRNTDKDTRPSLVIDEGDPANISDNKAYIFVSGKEGGSKICYKTLTIKSPLSTMGDFPIGDCGTGFIEDRTYRLINDATSTKQNVNKTTGIVVLAADDTTVPTTTQISRVYVHNVLGNPPPVVTAYGPKGPTPVTLSTVVTATFSKQINPATLNSTSFSLESAGGPVVGTVNYDATSRTATFVPGAQLAANTIYTAKLTNAIKDVSGQGLNAGIDVGPVIEQWSFTTGAAGVQFGSASYTVNEIEGTATITVVLDTPSAQNVTVNYATSDGTATTAGNDYTAASGSVTFAPGETSKSFTVAILDDATQEGAESLTLTLSNPTNALLGVQTTATLTIIDNESTTVQLNAASFSVDENVGQALIEVTLSKMAAFPVTVDYTVSAGTATAGDDYSVTNGTLTFAAGEQSKTFAITIVDDTLFEDAETINLTLANVTPVDAALGVPAAATLTIVDNDTLPTVAFSSATYNVNENGGNATITAQLSGASSQAVTVNYVSTDGTATGGSDYTAISGTLSFAPGETSKSVTIAIANDGLDEEDEVLDLALNTPTNANLGAVAGAMLTIADDDEAPTVQFESATFSVKENTSVVDIVVTLSAPSGKLVTVNYSSSNGTANEGSDYASAIGTLTFAPGETSKSIELSILNDKNVESNETLTVALSSPTNATAGATLNFALTIQDDDTIAQPTTKHLYLPLVKK